MPFIPPSLRTLAAGLLLTCGWSVAASAGQEVARPGSPGAEASAVLADSDIPGIDDGAALLDRLRLAQEVLGTGVSKEAEQALDSLIRRIDTVLMRGAVVLPPSYQFAGELWVPVKADRVRIQPGAPEILPRPTREGRREGAAEPLVEAFRIDWLALERTRTLLTDALQGIRGQGHIPPASRERLAEALAGIRQTTRLQDPVMEAYRAVKAVLASGETWQDEARDDLRQAADGLSAADAADPAARELGNLAEAAAPDVGRLVVAAAQLRARIATRPPAEASPGGAIQAVGAPVAEDGRAGGLRPGRATGVSGQ
jgi:hypothetical protein